MLLTITMYILSALSIIVMIIIRTDVQFSFTFDAGFGILSSAKIKPLFGLLNLDTAFAVTKIDDKWKVYFQLGRGKLRRMVHEKISEKLEMKNLSDILEFTDDYTIDQIKADITIGVQDAAALVLLSGTIKLLLEGLFAKAAENSSVSIKPCFNSSMLRINLEGIVTLHVEQIIIDALRMKKEKEGVKNGISTPY